MYLPPHFRETDPDRILELIQMNGFATLVSEVAGAPFATHLPLLFDPEAGKQGKLYGHFARPNPQGLEDGAEMLAIFHGPHCYVSPSWYATPGVATWNYAVVHVRGTLRTILDEATTLALVDALTEKYDPEVADPEGPVIAPEKKQAMLKGITAFEIEVSRIEAKFKLSQNRSIEDRQRVIAQLGQSEDQNAHEVSGLMLEDLVRGRSN